MEEKKLAYINFAMFAVLIVVVLIIFKPFEFMPKKIEIKSVETRPVPAVSEKPEQAVYDIDKIKPKDKGAVSVEAKDLAEVYANYPEEDVGNNIMKGWAEANPKDKKNFMDGLDKQIETQREAIKQNPEDRRAKSLLKMSETMKKLAQNNFNYKVKMD